ncbi:MAG: LptF/LptG family permease [Phycisphaera sp.]|nr:LptF/LptG family permease [Phycisphaera sp.]
MKTIDRYIIRLFLLNFVILFVVLVALFVLLDLISNFDEFVNEAQKVEGGWIAQTWETIRLCGDFYGPLTLLLYVYMAGLLPIGAAAFTFATLVRNNELLAMLSGGVSMHRIAMPVIVMGIAANAALMLDQEVLLPRYAQKVSRTQADVGRGDAGRLQLRFMPDGQGALFTAARFDVASNTMFEVVILRRERVADGRFGRALERVIAKRAVWDAAKSGWRLDQGFRIAHDVQVGGSGYASRRREEIDFLPSDLDPVTILTRQRFLYRQLLSLGQLSQLMDKDQVMDTAEIQRIRHSRFSIVVVNMLILVMGLPFFLMRVPGMLFKQAIRACALCVPAWGGGFIMMQIEPGMLNLPPAAIAWMPVAMYLPVAYYLFDSMDT